MAYRDLDFDLTDEQKALRDTIRKFGALAGQAPFPSGPLASFNENLGN